MRSGSGKKRLSETFYAEVGRYIYEVRGGRREGGMEGAEQKKCLIYGIPVERRRRIEGPFLFPFFGEGGRRRRRGTQLRRVCIQ